MTAAPSSAELKQRLLDSLRPGIQVTHDLLKHIYGWEMDYPGFADQTIAALEKAGCQQARELYAQAVAKIDAEFDAAYKEAGAWLMAQINQGGERQRQQTIDYLQTLSDRELLRRLQELRH